MEVQLINHAFDPDEINIKSGEEIIFKNMDSDHHTVTADDGSFDSGDIGPNTEYRYIFDSPGECMIHCEYHPEMRMKVTIE